MLKTFYKICICAGNVADLALFGTIGHLSHWNWCWLIAAALLIAVSNFGSFAYRDMKHEFGAT